MSCRARYSQTPSCDCFSLWPTTPRRLLMLCLILRSFYVVNYLQIRLVQCIFCVLCSDTDFDHIDPVMFINTKKSPSVILAGPAITCAIKLCSSYSGEKCMHPMLSILSVIFFSFLANKNPESNVVETFVTLFVITKLWPLGGKAWERCFFSTMFYVVTLLNICKIKNMCKSRKSRSIIPKTFSQDVRSVVVLFSLVSCSYVFLF